MPGFFKRSAESSRQPPSGVQRATRFPRQHPWVTVGTFLGGLGAALGALFAGLALFVDYGGSAGGAAETPPAPPPVPFDYTYHGITDKAKTISLSVPTKWANIDAKGWHASGLKPIPNGKYVGPGLVAAPSISKWNSDHTTPGIFVGASKIVRRSYSPNALLTQIEFFDCDAGPVRRIETPVKSGGSIRWTCDSGARWYAAAWWPPKTHLYVVYMQVKLVSPADDDALQNILETLTVKPLR